MNMEQQSERNMGSNDIASHLAAIYKDLFPGNEKIQSSSEKNTFEPLDTDKPHSSAALHKHLQGLQNYFEKYADKLIDTLHGGDKSALKLSDNQNKQQCPFKRVADACGFKYDKGGDKANLAADEEKEQTKT